MTATLSRPLTPASGVARWLQRPDDRCENGVLLIDGRPYLLSPVREPGRGRVAARRVVGWRLHTGEGKTYDVHPAAEFWRCDCGDAVYRRSEAPTPELAFCKHGKALRAALAAAGIDCVVAEGDPADCRLPSEM